MNVGAKLGQKMQTNKFNPNKKLSETKQIA